MVEVNRMTTQDSIGRRLIDRTPGAHVRIDALPPDRIKIRLVNEMESDPDAPPIPRTRCRPFLVWPATTFAEPSWPGRPLAGPNRTTVDILFDITNPGVWMAHCHIPSTCRAA